MLPFHFAQALNLLMDRANTVQTRIMLTAETNPAIPLRSAAELYVQELNGWIVGIGFLRAKKQLHGVRACCFSSAQRHTDQRSLVHGPGRDGCSLCVIPIL